MLQRFQQYCKAHRLYQQGNLQPGEANSRWLLAVSGGVDSMVLAHLCAQCGFETGVAHGNFTLRGAESDADEAFVRQWAQARQIPFYTVAFRTKAHAAERGISTQMAARDLRYAWLEEVRVAGGYTDIVVAHHADDNAETLLLNLTRGTGIRGLCGMQPVSGFVLRPLLFATRREIVAYAAAHGVSYREDSSNAHDDYARNRIRHQVMPALQQINAAAVGNMLQTARYLTQAQQVLEGELEKQRERICTFRHDEVHISLEALAVALPVDYWLYELLRPYHFSSTVVNDVLQALESQSGKRFYSDTHELIKDRNELIVVPLRTAETTGEWLVEKDCAGMDAPLSLHFSRQSYDATFRISPEKNTACLDAGKLKFPLILRRWREGDTFMPFGMRGLKKVSDFLIDEKVPLHEKEKQYVLLSGRHIVWLVGRRIDNRYRITENTRKIMTVKQVINL